MARGFDRNGWWIAALLLALLVTLGWLQYRWLGDLSRAERARAAAGLTSGVEAIARDFDRLLSQVALAFASRYPGEGQELDAARSFERWRAVARYPRWVRAVWQAESRDGIENTIRLDGATGRIDERPLPESLRRRSEEPIGSSPRIRRRLPRRLRFERFRPGLRDRPPLIYLPRMPAGRIPMGGPGGPTASLLIELDEHVLAESILRDLIDRYLPPLGGVAFSVVIERLADGTEVFSSGPPLLRDPGDAEALLFRLLPVEAMGAMTAGLTATDGGGLGRSGGRARPPFWDRLAAIDPPRWRLRVAHPLGSVDTQVGRARRRNLAVASGVLVVLAASMVFLVLGARQARALADQRLALVAAVTHELRTPLAAVRSAGANLADGVVGEPDKVRRYGRMIEAEGKRLSGLVEQTLLYTGALAGGTLDRVSVDLASLVDHVLRERRGLLEEAAMVAEVHIEEPVPAVLGDREALARALDNLIQNAVRHAAVGGRIDVSLRRADDRVIVQIADRGPGIAAADRKRVFEPFFRGESARADGPGTGIGLAVVRAIAEAHGGRVSVTRGDGVGAVFTLSLPVGGG